LPNILGENPDCPGADVLNAYDEQYTRLMATLSVR
jgi:hypothetical protein